MPNVGNSHMDGPACAQLTGSTCSLRTGVYRSGCLRNLVPLWGERTVDWLPTSVSCNPKSGWLFWLVTVTSGLSSGASGSFWSAGRGFGAVSECAAGVASGSRTTDTPLQGSGSASAVDSSLVPSTTDRFSVSADSVVLVSSVSSGSKDGLGDLRLAPQVLDRGWHLALVVGCLLPWSVETGELGWQSALLGLDIKVG